MKAIFIISICLIFLNTNIYAKYLMIEISAIIDSSNHFDKNTDSIIREYKYQDKNVSVISFDKRDKEKEKFIKNRFAISDFNYGIRAKWKIFFDKNKINVYAQSKKLISYLYKKNIKYTCIINNSENIADKYILNLKDKNNSKIIITDKIKNEISIQINKKDIAVIDGDTILYNNTQYRFLGIDAPEIAQIPYGSMASNFVYEQIKNASEVSIKIAEYDIYDRILAHIIIDGKSLSLILMQNKLSIQSITTYGDNGFESISTEILLYARKQGRLPFLSPSTFRKKNRK